MHILFACCFFFCHMWGGRQGAGNTGLSTCVAMWGIYMFVSSWQDDDLHMMKTISTHVAINQFNWINKATAGGIRFYCYSINLDLSEIIWTIPGKIEIMEEIFSNCSGNVRRQSLMSTEVFGGFHLNN